MNEYVIINGELYHYGVKGMKWGVRKTRKWATAKHQPSSVKSSYLAGLYAATGNKKVGKALEKSNDRDAANWERAKADYKRYKKAEAEKKELNADVKEYRKLRDDFGKSVNKSISRKSVNRDAVSNMNKLSKVTDFVNSKYEKKGKDYTAKMLDMVDKKDSNRAKATVAGVIGVSAAATVGLAWLETKFG